MCFQLPPEIENFGEVHFHGACKWALQITTQIFSTVVLLCPSLLLPLPPAFREPSSCTIHSRTYISWQHSLMTGGAAGHVDAPVSWSPNCLRSVSLSQNCYGSPLSYHVRSSDRESVESGIEAKPFFRRGICRTPHFFTKRATNWSKHCLSPTSWFFCCHCAAQSPMALWAPHGTYAVTARLTWSGSPSFPNHIFWPPVIPVR